MFEKLNSYIKRLSSKLREVLQDMEEYRAVSVMDIYQDIQTQLPTKVGENAYLTDIYDEDGKLFAIASNQGKMYKLEITVDRDAITIGDVLEVGVTFTPRSKDQLVVRKVGDRYRWFAFPACTAALNRSGEIDSTKLFDDFLERAQKSKEFPMLDFYHFRDKIALGKADWMARDGVAFLASGLFHDTEVGRAAAKSIMENPEYWGLSIAYTPFEKPEMLKIEEGIEIPVYNKGVCRFISLLPEKSAASIMTSIPIQEVTRMNKDVKEALEKLAGDDPELMKTLSAKIDGVNREAQDMITRDEKKTEEPSEPKVERDEKVVKKTTEETITKTADPEPVIEIRQEPPAPVPEEEPAPAGPEVAIDEKTMQAIVDAVIASPQLMEKVGMVLEDKLGGQTKEITDAIDKVKVTLSEDIEKTNERIASIVKEKEEEVTELKRNLPAKKLEGGTRNPISITYRPRAAITPAIIEERKAKMTQTESLSDKASATLSKMDKK